jgi:hypothetical protein
MRSSVLITCGKPLEKRASESALLPASTPSAPRAMTAGDSGRYNRADPPPPRERDRPLSLREPNAQRELPPRRDFGGLQRDLPPQRDSAVHRDYQSNREQPLHGNGSAPAGQPSSLQARLGDLSQSSGGRSPMDDRGRMFGQDRRGNDSPGSDERNGRKRNLECAWR